jgi:hypothetical protein
MQLDTKKKFNFYKNFYKIPWLFKTFKWIFFKIKFFNFEIHHSKWILLLFVIFFYNLELKIKILELMFKTIYRINKKEY